jgi:hypothetical protein
MTPDLAADGRRDRLRLWTATGIRICPREVRISPAASSSARCWPARLPASPICWCSTSRCRASISPARSRSTISSADPQHDRLRHPAHLARPACGDGRDRHRHLPQRPCLLPRHARGVSQSAEYQRLLAHAPARRWPSTITITTTRICRTAACCMPTARSPNDCHPEDGHHTPVDHDRARPMRIVHTHGPDGCGHDPRRARVRGGGAMLDDFFMRALVAGVGLAVTAGRSAASSSGGAWPISAIRWRIRRCSASRCRC